jgi:hypothetical protein
MKSIESAIKSLLARDHAAISTVAVAVIGAVGTSLVQGRVNWTMVGGVALVAIAGAAKSPIGVPGGTN